MELFKRKQKRELPPLLSEQDLIDYHSVLEWLVGLSDKDFDKIGKVATAHRKAYQEAAGILGKANEPTTFIDPPVVEDELAPFLEDKPKPKKAKNGKA